MPNVRPLVLATVLAVGACRSAPVTRSPEFPPPPAAPEEPAVTIPAVVGYSPGSHVWVVEQTAIIRQTEPPPPTGTTGADSLAASATIELTFTPSALDALTLEGRVSNMWTALIRNGEKTETALHEPVHFSGSATSFTRNAPTDPAAERPACDESGDAALALARAVILPIPRDLAPGRRWTDETSWTGCRGGVPVTTTTSSTYEAHAIPGNAGVLRMERQSVFTLAGSGVQGVTEVSVRGEGTSQATFHFDTRAGRVSSGSSATSATLVFDTVQHTFRLIQESRMSLSPSR